MIRRLVALSFLLTAVVVAAGAGTTSAAFAEQAEASLEQEGWAAQNNDPSQPVEDQITENLQPVPVDPVAPATVPPGSLPVGLLAGQPEWKSFLQFDLSAVPFDASIDSFVITLTEVEPGESLTGVEVCATTDLWAEGANQKWSNAPEHDCTFSADLVAADDGTWTADMTNVAQAWQDVIIPNNGVVLLPKSATNLPSGQPTPQEANWRVQFAGATLEGAPTAQVEYTVAASPSPPPPPPPAAAPPADSGQTGGTANTGTSSQPFFGNSPSFEPQAGPAFTPPVAPGEGALPPEVAPDDAGQQPVPETVAAPAVAGDAETPAYVWALIPLFLLGMLMLGRSLTDTTPVIVTRREGATTRLIRNRRGLGTDALAPSEPSFQV